MQRFVRGMLLLSACWLLCGNSELFARNRRCCRYSYGSYGSSGGSCVNYAKGNSGYTSANSTNSSQQRAYYSYASYGSTGGSTTYQQPAASQPRVVAKSVQPQNHRVTLELTVPEAAQVYLVNQRMSLQGTTRRFVVPVSDATKSYQYRMALT